MRGCQSFDSDLPVAELQPTSDQRRFEIGEVLLSITLIEPELLQPLQDANRVR